MAEKRFGKMLCVGYMPDSDVLKYLEEHCEVTGKDINARECIRKTFGRNSFAPTSSGYGTRPILA